MRREFQNRVWLFTCDHRNRGIVRMNFDEAGTWSSAAARKRSLPPAQSSPSPGLRIFP